MDWDTGDTILAVGLASLAGIGALCAVAHQKRHEIEYGYLDERIDNVTSSLYSIVPGFASELEFREARQWQMYSPEEKAQLRAIIAPALERETARIHRFNYGRSL